MEACPRTVLDISNSGVRIRGEIRGSGHPIVFLHGFPEFHGIWNRQVAHLCSRHLTIAPDLRGFNLSDRPAGMKHYSSDALASDILAILDQLSCGSATVVGHDIGGLAAWWLAARHPDRVDRLILISSPHPADYLSFRTEHPAHRNYLDDILDGKTDALMVPERLAFWANETERPSLLAALQRTDFDAVRSIYRMSLGRDCLPQWLELPRISVPSLVIYGEADEFIKPEAFATIQKWFAKPATIVKLADGGHFLHSRMADQVNFIINYWLCETRQIR